MVMRGILWLILALCCVGSEAQEAADVLRLGRSAGEFRVPGVAVVSQETPLPYAWDYWRRGTQGSAKFEIPFFFK